MQNNMYRTSSYNNRFNRREFFKKLGNYGISIALILKGITVFTGCDSTNKYYAQDSLKDTKTDKNSQFKITFDAAKNNSSLRQQYVKERKQKTLDMIAEIYGKNIRNKIPTIDYIDKITNYATHFTFYGTHRVEQIFRGNITIDSIGVTADCFEGRGSSIIQNEADFMAALVGKEGGLVALINEGAGGLVWSDFSLGGELFNRKIHSPFAEAYSFGLTHKHIRDGRFNEFEKNSKAYIDHTLNLYFYFMAVTLIRITKYAITNTSRNNGETLVTINNPRAVKIMNALLIPMGNYLQEYHKVDINKQLFGEKSALKYIEFSKNEQAFLRITFKERSGLPVHVYHFSNYICSNIEKYLNNCYFSKVVFGDS